jgi:carotenoid cleavage dioxygenase
VSADGKLVQSEEISVGGPTMMQNFAVTGKHAIFMDLPVVFDLQLAIQGSMPFHWSDDYPARMGIMPRTGSDADVKWFDVDPCFVFHGLNAWDDGDQVVFDACRISEVWRNAGQMVGGDGVQTLHRFRFDMASGATVEETLDECGMDFPRVPDARVGQKNRHGYTVQFGSDASGNPGFVGLLQFDMQRGSSETHAMGAGRSAGECVFVPAAGSDPDGDEGWVMTYVYDAGSNTSEFVIIDATRFADEPVARVKLPQRVPFGFHGSWLPDEA